MQLDTVKNTALFISLLLIGGCGPMRERASSARSDTCDLRMWYDSTTGHTYPGAVVQGQVGYHMAVTRRTYVYEGCRNSHGSASGIPNYKCSKDLIVGGALPPGINFDDCFQMNLSGTPQQPGTWTVVIRMPEYVCPCGTKPPHDVTTTFNIKGIAAKRVR